MEKRRNSRIDKRKKLEQATLKKKPKIANQ